MITYVICTRNRPSDLETLARQLRKSINDSGRPIKVLIIDSASDFSNVIINKDIAKKYQFNYSFSKKSGLSIARNFALNLVNTKYIYFLDDDICIQNSHAKQLVNIIIRHKPEFVGGPIHTLFPPQTPRWYDRSWNDRKFQGKSGFNCRRLSGGNFGGVTRIIKSLGGFNVNLGMDGERVQVGEERDLIERYLINNAMPKIYYDLKLKVYEPLPLNKLKFTYRMKREYAIGSADIIKKDYSHKNYTYWRTIFQFVNRVIQYRVNLNHSLSMNIRYFILHICRNLGLGKLNLSRTKLAKKKENAKLLIFFYEHVARELPTLLSIKDELEKKGNYKVLILNIITDRWIIYFTRPLFCFIPYYYDDSDTFFRVIKSKPEITFYSLSWEQIFYPAKVNYKIPKNTPQNVKFLVWTYAWYNTLMESKVPVNQLIHLGHPLWSLLKFNKQASSQKKEKILLYIENSSLAFAKKSSLNRLSKNADETQSIFRKLLEKNLQLLHAFSEQENYRVFIRVRPATKLSHFIKFAESSVPQNSFSYSKDSALQKDIADSNLIVTEMSTSILEASLSKNSVYLIHTTDIPQEFNYDWFKLYPKITNVKEFKKFERSHKINSKVEKWMLNQGALNPNYVQDFLHVIESEAQSRHLYGNKSSIFNANLIQFFLPLWRWLFAKEFSRKLYFLFIEKGFSAHTHEKDFILLREYQNYQLKYN